MGRKVRAARLEARGRELRGDQQEQRMHGNTVTEPVALCADVKN